MAPPEKILARDRGKGRLDAAVPHPGRGHNPLRVGLPDDLEPFLAIHVVHRG